MHMLCTNDVSYVGPRISPESADIEVISMVSAQWPTIAIIVIVPAETVGGSRTFEPTSFMIGR